MVRHYLKSRLYIIVSNSVWAAGSSGSRRHATHLLCVVLLRPQPKARHCREIRRLLAEQVHCEAANAPVTESARARSYYSKYAGTEDMLI